MNNAISQTRNQTQQLSVPGFLDVRKRHRLLMVLSAAAAVVFALTITIYGWHYYILDQAHRPFSPLHAELKPSGTIGLRLGILGFCLFVLVYLYPLRKRWSFLLRFGRTKHWFDYHILLGLVAPVIISFHCAFKAKGFAGMAYYAMVALVVSGLVGRYFYAQIPRSIGAAEMSLKEMQELSAEIMEDLKLQQVFSAGELESLFRLPGSKEVQSMPILRAILLMTTLDLARPFKVWALRRKRLGVRGSILTLGGVLHTRQTKLEKAISLASEQASIAKRILFLSKTHRIFHLWHVIHRPFSVSFAILVIIHVAVVISLGYF